MEWTDVLTRIGCGENEHTEFKQNIDLKKIGKTLAAFANSEGGLLVLGVGDDGRIMGIQKDPEAASERLTSFLQSGLSTPLRARIGRKETPSGWVHWIEVPRQRGLEPVYHEGAVFVRRGRASVEPSSAERADLFNAFGYIVTEELAISTTSPTDIEISAFHRYLTELKLDLISEPRVALEDDLLARGVVARYDHALCPTVYGILAFGKSPQDHLQTQNFFIQCTVYSGTDRAAPVNQVFDAKGRLDEQVKQATAWLIGQPRQEIYRDLQRIDLPLLPLRAIREAVVNAVAHRDYAIIGSKILIDRFTDRVEITSPGRLPNGMTVNAIERGGNPRARNQSITNFLQTMGFMEQRGRGWPIIVHEMQKHNKTIPILDVDSEARWLRVTLLTPQILRIHTNNVE